MSKAEDKPDGPTLLSQERTIGKQASIRYFSAVTLGRAVIYPPNFKESRLNSD